MYARISYQEPHLSFLGLFRRATSRRQTHEDLERIVNHPLQASESANHDNTVQYKLARHTIEKECAK